jgi:hypothetical protein
MNVRPLWLEFVHVVSIYTGAQRNTLYINTSELRAEVTVCLDYI